jgi:hypothetical protein
VSPRLQTRSRCRRAPTSPCALWHWVRHPPGKRSSVTTCPVPPDPLLVRRALTSPCAPQHWARHSAREGSGVAVCLTALDPSSALKGFGIATCPRHQNHHPTGLQYRHVSCGSGPASRCGRALEPPRALWPSAFEACLCVPKAPDIRLIMASPGTRSRQHIICIQDKPYAVYD